ncbi:MAG TPA: hypothetical protein VLT79_00550 [Gemmatimonadales bacterium]|nr:hypothetical protein [Gemmatimonadales bacterium]
MHQSLADRYPAPLTSRAAAIERAALRAVAYSDVFDYALDFATLHRYLHGIKAHPDETARVLGNAAQPAGAIVRRHGYYTLAGREDLVAVRQRRAGHAARLWPRAIAWGLRIAHLPFVRMVAVTGALAWSNVESDADVDLLIVAKPGRVWLVRALVAFIGRLSRLAGVHLCPNYVLSTNALELTDRSVYTAYELVHMVPIAGVAMYRRLRRLNRWTDEYFPNAAGEPHATVSRALARPQGIGQRLVRDGVKILERKLENRLGETLERWEMARCIRRRAGRARVPTEALYSREYFKDHLAGHQHVTLTRFAERLSLLGLEDS